jgi:hypothetical protein
MKKPTIKHQVIKAISERKEVTRKDIQKFIWVAQGNTNPFQHRQGYYGTNIREWQSQDLIKRVRRGVYVITPEGLEYIDNPKSLGKRLKAKEELWKIAQFDSLRNEVRELRWENATLKREIFKLKTPSVRECLDYFSAMNGNYSGDTKHYLDALINHVKRTPKPNVPKG